MCSIHLNETLIFWATLNIADVHEEVCCLHYCSLVSRSSYDGHEEASTLELNDEAVSDGQSTFSRVNGGDGGLKEAKLVTRQLPTWLSNSIPDEFLVRDIFYSLLF